VGESVESRVSGARPRTTRTVRRSPRGLFRFLLELADGEPYDPAMFVTVIPSWSEGETFLVTAHQRLRILAIDYELVEQGVNAVFTVEPA
jgi:hypothetical protein